MDNNTTQQDDQGTTYVLDHAITVGEEYGWPPITSVVIIDAEVAR